MMNDMLFTWLMGAGITALLFFVIWLVHLYLRNAAVVDIGWGLGFIILCLFFIQQGAGFTLRNTLCFLMVALWGGRIVLYLLKRFTAEHGEDKRYAKMRAQFGKGAWYKFLYIFQFQAALEMLIAIPLLTVSRNPDPGLSLWEIIGAVVFAAALWGETVADEQLHAFKHDPANRGKTCTVGLWRYSRHPNYFFEWLVWVGIWIFALGSPMGWLSIISPIVMYYLLMYVSGVPLAEEQSLKSRGDEYRKYQAVTSVFFPMPVKNTKSL